MMIAVIALFFMSCVCFVGQLIWSAFYFAMFERNMSMELAAAASCNLAFCKASRPRFKVLSCTIL